MGTERNVDHLYSFQFPELVEPEDIDARTYRIEDRRATLAVVCQETDHRKRQRRS